MTLCPWCEKFMAARTYRELHTRLQHIGDFPDVGVSQCPQCGGTEWATTDKCIVTVARRPWWRRLIAAVKSPPIK